MRRIQIAALQVLLCAVLSLACHQILPPSATSHPPPTTSYRVESISLVKDGSTRMIRAALIRPEFMKAVDIHPSLGRSFVEEEYKAGARGVVVLSHGFWVRAFGAGPDVLGETLDLNGIPYTVIGIMPKTFTHPEGAEIWVPDQRE